MNTSRKTFFLLLAGLAALQILFGLWKIQAPFTDGRIHYNWNPSFWLLKAQDINETGIAANYFGVAGYKSHPQLIGPVIATWTDFFGYEEGLFRLLALLITVLTTVILVLAFRNWLGERRALMFGAFFAALPMIYIYGRMMNQEILVMFFLALYLLGLSTLSRPPTRTTYALILMGTLGMTLSDWSGFVFAALLPLVFWRAARTELQKRTLKHVLFISYAGALLGFLIFLVQGILQTGSTLGRLADDYISLWNYRAGSGSTLTLGKWLGKNAAFITTNYSWILFGGGFFYLLWSLLKKRFVTETKKGEFVSVSLVLGVALGNLVYMAAVPQASFVHLYYQYFFAVPLALALVLGVSYLSNLWKLKKKGCLVLFSIMILVVGAYAAYQFNRLHKLMIGDETDIELLKAIKNVPEDLVVIGAHVNEGSITWFENPNIEYYAGRTIQGYVMGDGIPLADYQVIPREVTNEFLDIINSGEAYGPSIVGASKGCSKEFCLLELSERTN